MYIEHATDNLTREVQDHIKRLGIHKLKQLQGVSAISTQFVETITELHNTINTQNMTEALFKDNKQFCDDFEQFSVKKHEENRYLLPVETKSTTLHIRSYIKCCVIFTDFW